MDNSALDAVEQRRHFVEGWNSVMVDIWAERIDKLNVVNTGALYRSLVHVDLRVDPEGKYLDFSTSHMFLEYGLWQDMGTGREIKIGNPGDVKCLDPKYREEHGLNEPRTRGPKWGGGKTSGDPRKARRWFSTKYYSSTMRLKEFLAESIGKEFVGLFAKLEAEDYRKQTEYYKRKGLT